MTENPVMELDQALLVTNVTKRFSGIVALDSVSFELKRGEILSLIGPNGSGKTTMFNCITGFYRPEQGSIEMNSIDLTKLRPDEIALKGMRRTFQSVSIFPSMTVLENLIVSLQQFQEENNTARILNTQKIRNFDSAGYERAAELIKMVGLDGMEDVTADNLVYGQRKLLEFACVLISDPKIILLDEPAAGVNTAMVDRMKQYIRQLNGLGKTILLVEHNMGMVMDISDRIIVLDHGKKIAEGTPDEIRANQQVREAYFGK